MSFYLIALLSCQVGVANLLHSIAAQKLHSEGQVCFHW